MPCHDLISDQEIEKIYKNVHPLVTSHSITTSCQSPDKKQAYIHLYDGVTKINHPEICSYFLKDERIYGTDEMRGKVVENSLTVLNNAYKRKGIGTHIHNKEKKIYKDNGFFQIHLTAVYDGLIYWPSKKFNFVHPQDESMLVAQWKSYVSAANGLGITGKDYADITKNVVSFKQINKQYLLPADLTKPSFTDWLCTKQYALCNKMYKNL